MSIELVSSGAEGNRPYDFIIDLRSPLGNPFTAVDICDDEKYKLYFDKKIINQDYSFLMYLRRIISSYAEFNTVRLVCSCGKENCHGNYIKQWLEKIINRGVFDFYTSS